MMQEKATDPIIGNSPEMTAIRRAVKKMANENQNILILGDIGSGRTYISQLLHNSGNRKNKPFITVNCPAIGETIDPDEIFADNKNGNPPKGSLLFSAQNGTLCLDDLDKLQAEFQERLFGFFTSIFDNDNATMTNELNTRIIATAEPDLLKKTKKKNLRNDLYHKLSQFRLVIPSLTERRQDIPFLFTHFLEDFCQEFEKPAPTIPNEIFDSILDYEWPGNVSELKNCVRNLVIMSPDGTLSPEYLPFRIQQHPLEMFTSKDLPTAVAEVEKYLIRKALARYEGNQSKAARFLNLSEAALRYKLKKYGLPTAR